MSNVSDNSVEKSSHSSGRPKRRYLSDEELTDGAGPRSGHPGAARSGQANPPVGSEAHCDDDQGGVRGPLYTTTGKRRNRLSYKQMASMAAAQPYEIQEMVARGAESVLYRATIRGHTFCVKCIRNFFGRHLECAERRQNDGKLEDVSYATKVRHLRNEFEVGKHLHEEGDIPVVSIYALRKVRRLGVELGYDLLLEYIDGRDMGHKQFTSTLSVEDKIRILYQTLKALRFIHSRHYVHMDMKPSNIMVLNHGDVKLIDFGVTVSKGHLPTSVTGTTGYLSPEQIVKDYLDEATDMFSLGVTFAVIFGGHPLRQSQDELKSKTFRSEAQYHLNQVDQPAVTLFPELSDYPELAEVLCRCTIAKRDKRMENTGPVIPLIERLADRRGFPLDVSPE